MTEAEYLELLVLSTIVIPNMNSRHYNVESALRRQEELFNKAAKPYSYYEDVEFVSSE